MLLEALASLDIVTLNHGTIHTFNNGRSGSIIDLTFASRMISRQIKWEVSPIYTHSDHQAIIFEIGLSKRFQIRRSKRRAQQKGWKTKQMDSEMLEYMLDSMEETQGSAESRTSRVMDHITNACDAAMPRKGGGNGRTQVYWWNETIATLRAECHRCRRRHQRSRGSEHYEQTQAEFKEKRRQLRKAIKKARVRHLTPSETKCKIIPGAARIE